MAVWLPRQASATKFTDRTRKVRHGMTVTRPAGTWSEALPVGNGSVGAMAYGDARQETILLNHEALFYPLWAKPEHVPNMAQYLPEVRRLISEGKYKEAESYWNSKLADHDYGLQRAPFTNPYHPAFDLVLRRKADAQVESEPVKGYREQLDFEKAEATATWREGDIEYERLMFVSRTDDVLVVRVRGSKAGSVTTHIGLAPHEPVEDIWPKYMGSSKEYLLGRKAYTDEPITYKTRARGAWLTLSGKYWDGRQFGGVGRVVAKGGRQEVVGKHIAVKNADEVLVILKLFTNEKRGRQAIKQLRSEIGAMTAEYESLLETHVKEHKELLSRITLDLNAGEDRELSNKELLEKARNGEIPASLVERLFEYGRYLLICSSRPGGLPANLQGVWSGTWTRGRAITR
jgi:alpha-L-fucosidase 2